MTVVPRPLRVTGALALVAVAAGLAIGLAWSGSEQDRATPLGPPAPDLVLPGFEGGQVKLADFQGRPLVVNFWASWCAPCLAELPGFERVYQRHRPTVAFLGINLADDPEGARWVLERTGITYPLARDPEGEAFTAFDALGMPTTVFIAADGSIVERYSGELTAAQLEEKITSYFGG